MIELAFGAALLAGLAGSGHCLAMCGGMAGLLAAKRDSAGRLVKRTITYNLGRITSYAIGGALAGLLGYAIGLATGLGMAAGQLRILSGVIIILAGLYLLTGRRIFAPFEKLGESIWKRLSPYAVRQIQRDGSLSTLSLGMLWGWLPCGLTWSMLAIAAASGSPAHGGGVMFAFGLGTLPAMLAAGLAGFKLRGLLNRTAFRHGAATFLIAAGVWTAAFPISMQHGPTHDHPSDHAHQTQADHAHHSH